MTAFGDALLLHSTLVVDDFIKAIDGIPNDDLNTWKPSMTTEGEQVTNTFAGLAVHTAAVAEYLTFVAVGGQPDTRDRANEFTATTTFEEISTRLRTWIANLKPFLDGLTDEQLAATSTYGSFAERGWTNAQVILHTLDHTALHTGHAEIHRQLWEHERAGK